MHLLRLGVVEQAEHISANPRAAWLSHVETGRNRNGCIGAVAALLQDLDTALRGQWLRGGYDASCAVDDGAARREGDELGIGGRVEGGRVERHSGGGV